MTQSLAVEPRAVKRGEKVFLDTVSSIAQSGSFALAETPNRGQPVHGLAAETGQSLQSGGGVLSPVLPAVWTAGDHVGSLRPPLEGHVMNAPLQRRSHLPRALALELYELEPCESDEELPELDLGLYELEEQS